MIYALFLNTDVRENHLEDTFQNKERTQRFYDLEIENFNRENILVGLHSRALRLPYSDLLFLLVSNLRKMTISRVENVCKPLILLGLKKKYKNY